MELTNTYAVWSDDIGGHRDRADEQDSTACAHQHRRDNDEQRVEGKVGDSTQPPARYTRHRDTDQQHRL